ncbi:MAG: hypothetical protein ACJ8OJ_01555 [Povalibacter sp.]
MNTLERRRIAKAQVIDVEIAKAAINKSRRDRAEAAKQLRKAMATKHVVEAIKSETIGYPKQAVG